MQPQKNWLTWWPGEERKGGAVVKGILGPGQVAFNNKIIEHQSIKLSQVQHKLKDQIVMGRKRKGTALTFATNSEEQHVCVSNSIFHYLYTDL